MKKKFLSDEKKKKHMELDAWKSLFVDGLKYSAEHCGFFLRPSSELGAIQKRRVLAATDFQEFADAVQIYNFTRGFGFPTPVEVSEGQLLGQANVDFNSSLQSSYFLAGATDLNCFAFTVWRCNVAPPAVVAQKNLDPNKAVIWMITGGFGGFDVEWRPLPKRWLTNVIYEQWSPSEFLLTCEDPVVKVRFGSPEAMRFQLNLVYGETDVPTNNTNNTNSVHVILQGRAPPRWTLQLNLHQSHSYVFNDMELSFSTGVSPSIPGLGIVQHSELIPLPTTFFSEVDFIRTWRSFKDLSAFIELPVLSVFIQFRAYQYAFTMQLPAKVSPGMLLTNAAHGIRSSFGFVQKIGEKSQILIASTVEIAGREYPYELQMMLNDDVITGEAGWCYGLAQNPIHQADFEAVYSVRDTQNAEGIAVLRINNVLSTEVWSQSTFGSFSPNLTTALVRQPTIVHLGLANFLIALPWILLSFILLVLLLLTGLGLSHKKI
jgi:hypothetical protein